MIVLFFFAFISGLVTIFAPCIWPILPIILSSSATGGRAKPLGITLGIMISFTVFTLTLSYIVKIFPFDPNFLRLFAVVIIGFLGLVLIIPKLNEIVEGFVSRLSARFLPKDSGKSGFIGGLVTGLSLGVVWTPCAGPILATIATLAATQSLNLAIILTTFFYVFGVGIPLFIFASLGRKIFTRSRGLTKYTGKIQKVFGVVMILTALAIFTNFDKTIQVKLLNVFPSYSNFIVNLENNEAVKKELDNIKNQKQGIEVNNLFENYGQAADFVGITKWLNTDKPLTISGLEGKVVLIDFWTYTCINCIRTLPYVTSWYDKYKDKGFVVVGVHTPEFEFEKNTENVKGAIKQFNIHYPVAQDNDYTTWNAYSNQYWPAEYLIDATGKIRRTHFGEGEYDQMEMAIKDLLIEAGKDVSKTKLNEYKNESQNIGITPESYLGVDRLERFESKEGVKRGVTTYTKPENMSLNAISYQGKWDVEDTYAMPYPSSSLYLNFYAEKVFLVITPNSKEEEIEVFLDGKKISLSEQGKDVSEGVVKPSESRLYELVDLKKGAANHLLRLEFKKGSPKVFAFTFG